jgi:Flp pilus assembly protein TadG
MRRCWAALWDDARGAAIVEFAVLGPVLLGLLLGIVEVGRMFYVRQALEYATEEAARYYMLNPTSASTAVTTYLQGKMAGTMGSGISVGYDHTTSCNGNSAVTCTTITASYSFASLVGYLGLGTQTLRARAQAVRYPV